MEISAWGLTADAIAESFEKYVKIAAEDASELTKDYKDSILREDIVKCLETALKRQLQVQELALVGRCFVLDTSALISRAEFELSIGKMKALASNRDSNQLKSSIKSRARLLAARKKGFYSSSGNGGLGNQNVLPLTSSQEIGWGHAAAEAAGIVSNVRSKALKGSDITAGGEGSSLMSYYGPALGRTF